MVESRGLGGEQSALVVRDRYSGMCLTYPQRTRDEDSNYDALKHFGGSKLNGNPDVVFHSDTAQELTNAASRLGWVADPSAANHWPHNAFVEREIRTIMEMCRPSHCKQVSIEDSGPFPSSTQPLQDPSSVRLRSRMMRETRKRERRNLARRDGRWPQANLLMASLIH